MTVRADVQNTRTTGNNGTVDLTRFTITRKPNTDLLRNQLLTASSRALRRVATTSCAQCEQASQHVVCAVAEAQGLRPGG